MGLCHFLDCIVLYKNLENMYLNVEIQIQHKIKKMRINECILQLTILYHVKNDYDRKSQKTFS